MQITEACPRGNFASHEHFKKYIQYWKISLTNTYSEYLCILGIVLGMGIERWLRLTFRLVKEFQHEVHICGD